jgi:Fic family protein
MRKIVVGACPVGKEKVRYQAPPAARVRNEMARFLRWFADPGAIDPLLVAGLAHLWFVNSHPFADGNGRIARAIGLPRSKEWVALL